MQCIERAFEEVIKECCTEEEIVAMFRYVDDLLFLLCGKHTEGKIPRIVKLFAMKLIAMGITLSLKKSDLAASPHVKYLGMVLDLTKRTYSVDPEMKYRLREKILGLFPKAEMSMDQLDAEWSNVIGKI